MDCEIDQDPLKSAWVITTALMVLTALGGGLIGLVFLIIFDTGRPVLSWLVIGGALALGSLVGVPLARMKIAELEAAKKHLWEAVEKRDQDVAVAFYADVTRHFIVFEKPDELAAAYVAVGSQGDVFVSPEDGKGAYTIQVDGKLLLAQALTYFDRESPESKPTPCLYVGQMDHLASSCPSPPHERCSTGDAARDFIHYKLLVKLDTADASRLETRIEEISARLLDEFIDELPDEPLTQPGVTPRLVRDANEAELLAADWIRSMGWPQAVVTPPSGDEGIDVIGYAADRGTVAAQVKFEARPAGRPMLQGLYGAGHGRGASHWLFFSSAGYTTEAREWADRMRIGLFRFSFDGSIEPMNEMAEEYFG